MINFTTIIIIVIWRADHGPQSYTYIMCVHSVRKIAHVHTYWRVGVFKATTETSSVVPSVLFSGPRKKM